MTKSANPVPQGIHTVTPYLMLKDVRKAIKFYEEAFGAKEICVMEIEGKIMHAQIKIGDSVIMMGEEYPEMGKVGAETRGFATSSLHLSVEDVDAAFARAEQAGCKVNMPVTDMFWGDRYCHITDPFNQEWGIATHIHDYTPEQIEANFKEAKKHMAGCAQ